MDKVSYSQTFPVAVDFLNVIPMISSDVMCGVEDNLYSVVYSVYLFHLNFFTFSLIFEMFEFVIPLFMVFFIEILNHLIVKGFISTVFKVLKLKNHCLPLETLPLLIVYT